MAAAIRGSVKRIRLDLDHRNIVYAGDARAALERSPSHVCHLTKALSSFQNVEHAFALSHSDFARRQDEERCAGFALPNQGRAGCDTMPVRDVQDLPQVHVGEVPEELEASQRVEL